MFSASTSSSRRILAATSERIPEPSQRSQGPSEGSQEQPERGLALGNRKWPKEKIEQIVELKRIKTLWPEIRAAVGMTQNTCQIWEDHQRRQERAKVTIQVTIPDTIPEPSRQGKRWSSDER